MKDTGSIKGNVLETRLLLLLKSIVETYHEGGFNIGRSGDGPVDIERIEAETLSFLEQAVKEKIEREQNSPDPDPPRDRTKPRVVAQCSFCDFFDRLNGAQGVCKITGYTVLNIHSCGQFEATVEEDSEPDPPDRCSNGFSSDHFGSGYTDPYSSKC